MSKVRLTRDGTTVYLTRVTDGLSRQLNKRDVDASLDLLARELRDEPRMLYLFTKDADKRLKLTRNVVLNYLCVPPPTAPT